MKKIKKQKRAFSLAEALITLLIVSLIAIASIPVLTKKKRTLEINVHGRWECSYYGNRYMTKTTVDGVTTTSYPTTGSCVFNIPAKAKNFNVVVVGGGGGGAAGSYPYPKIYTSSRTITVPDYSEYKIAVVGSGGSGGGLRCGTITQGGGSGGYVLTTKVLKPGVTYSVNVGQTSGCQSCDGQASSFSGSNIATISVSGGQGGDSRKETLFDCKWNGDKNAEGGSPNGVSGKSGHEGDWDSGGKITNPELQDYTRGYYGNGAAPRYYSGYSGVIGLSPSGVSSGGAGTPGVVVSRVYPALKGPITVTLGMAGARGSENGAAGNPGGTTRFGTLMTAQGGLGGEPRYKVSSSEITKGENAQVPSITKDETVTKSYGGFTVNNPSNSDATQASYDGINGSGAAGAGGGGSPTTYGYGAIGRPGAVIIEW